VKTRLTELLRLEYPVIMAPMFLVSNVKMTIAAADSGICGCIPALNFRHDKALRQALRNLSDHGKPYGINLIVNRTNFHLESQLKACLDYKVPFIITSLGNPQQVIEKCKPLGIKVFCDVSDMDYARKAASFKPDGLIAVTNQAGGHLGPLSPEEIVPALVAEFPDLIIISAGGVGDEKSLKEKLALGADGVSVGSLFIASEESDVCEEYKSACVIYGAKDVVTTTKLSGIPCTVINTPYVQKIGTRQNVLQVFLNKSRRLKKWFKLFTYLRGMNLLHKAAFDANYKNVWCAGTTIEYVHSILPVKEIVRQLVKHGKHGEH
jgi:nitronate monooxygenase